MEWKEKRPKTADSNIKNVGYRWEVRVKLLLPDRSVFEREHRASSRTAARKLRDDIYAAYNAQALAIVA